MAYAILTSNESGADSLTDINANFALAAPLASPTFTGTPVLPTGTTGVTQSANDNSTKLATTAYVDSTVGSSSLTIIPKPNFVYGTATDGLTPRDMSTNTTMYVAQFVISNPITVNKVSFYVQAVDVAGVAKLALYSEDGQTKVFEVSTASISGTGVITTSLSSPTVILPGNYYFAALPSGTCNVDVIVYNDISTYMDALIDGVTSEPIINGTVTVTASTIPSTITPTSITSSDTTSRAILFRLDN